MWSTVAMMLAPGLAEDDDRNRALAVQIAGGTDVLHGVCHLSDIGQADSRTVVIADDEGLVVVRFRDLVIGNDVRGHNAIGDLALGQIGVLQAQHGLQIRKGKSRSWPIAWDLRPHGRPATRRRRH